MPKPYTCIVYTYLDHNLICNVFRFRHSVDSVASYSSQNHVDRIRTQNFSAASCHDEDFGSIKTSLFRRSSSNLDCPRRPESVTSNTSSTRSRLRELVERKSSQDDHKSAANAVGDIQYFENPTETLEFDKPRNSLEKKQEERPKKRKLSKNKEKDKDKDTCDKKKHEKYQSKLAEYYKLPVQLPQDEFYQHLTRSKAAEDPLQKRFSNSDTEFSGSYGRLCKHKEPEGSNLRRSRSLAVIREETFTDLQIQNHGKNKRSQLIPRARLFDKPCFKDRLIGRAKYQTKEEVLENIYIESTASCFGDINGQKDNDIQTDKNENKSEKEDATSQHESHRSRSVCGSWPNLNEEVQQIHRSEESIGPSRNPSDIDSLDSNYVRKHYNFDAHLKNYKDSSPETERSIVSPTHSKELYVTTDDHDTDNEGRSKNNTPKSYTNDSLSITQSDKDKVEIEADHGTDTESSNDTSVKTNNSVINEDLKQEIIQTSENNHDENDGQSLASENDGTISSPADSITSYISISIASSADKSHKLEYLANSLAEKIDEYCDSQFKENASVTSNTINSEANHQESDPIYTKVNKKKTFADIRRDSFINKSGNLFNEIPKKPNNEVYVSNTYIESDTYSTKSNCTSSKNITTEPYVTTLIENQYYSLPDINISKCLRKSERIDAQLREEDPEDIPCENTYEIAQTHFREILSTKASDNYGQLNKTQISSNNDVNVIVNSNAYKAEYTEPQIIESFSKLEDDLKSIITIDSSITDDKDLIYYQGDTHQNERELNEIEGTIRNNKVITKSESLKINNSTYKPDIKIPKSLSNDNINKSIQKSRTGIKKHYSLRQRDPIDDEVHRLPSPDTVERTFHRPLQSSIVRTTHVEELKTPLVTRVQSFKTSADSSIAIVPLSGHQTIVIDPPLTQEIIDNKQHIIVNSQSEQLVYNSAIGTTPKPEQLSQSLVAAKPVKTKVTINPIDISSYYTPKDPFITIKLNKVVKTTIPNFKNNIEKLEKSKEREGNFNKPPPKLIIKDKKSCNNNSNQTQTKIPTNMTRPQVLQVIDSKNKKQDNPMKTDKSKEVESTKSITGSSKVEYSSDIKQDMKEIKPDSNAKEKLNNAIKTDMEYQEKLNSVKNYWSKLVEHKICDTQDNTKTVYNSKSEDLNNNKNDSNNKQEETIVYQKQTEENTEQRIIDENNSPEVSVGSIIKSLESVKIVDSIRKISQTKLQLWKDETEKVKSDSEIEEPTVQKIVKDSEGNFYEKPKPKNIDTDSCRDTPEIEIVELSSDDNQNKKTQATLIKPRGFDKSCDEFDHVRYKVMKSELFKNSMIANYRKEAQFDGLLQYLQDYSFQELLVNNNIVIIEPVRSKIEPAPRRNNPDTCKIPPTLLRKSEHSTGQVDRSKNAIRRHFFYHPIRVNKEIIEEELPNPDTVKKVRNLFEDTLKMKSPMTHDPPLVDENGGLTRRATSYRNLSEETKGNKIGGRKKVIRQLTIDTNFGNKKWDNASLSSGVSSGDLSSNNEYDADGLSPYTHKNLKDNVYSSSDEYLCDSANQDFCCESQYVSPDILKKIRECGTTVTYYGGKVLNSKPGSTLSPMTKAIMEEIKNLQKNCSRDCVACQTKCRGEKCLCLVADKPKHQTKITDSINLNHGKNTRVEIFPGFKFKLVKSNSCSSRLELTGTDDSKNPRLKFRKHSNRLEDPPLVYEEGNSVKNKICRLESYTKGIAKTPFENKEGEDSKITTKTQPEVGKLDIKKAEMSHSNTNLETKIENNNVQEITSSRRSSMQTEKINDAHTFEKKFYYVNENMDQSKAPTGKFGEMVFEEFEVLESCYDSLNSNKSVK